MAYLFRGVLFVGDALDFKHGHLDIPAETFADDPAAGRRSLAQLASALGDTDVRVVCTGHGGCTPPGAARALLAEVLAKL
jgi:glyoxylase-like metal-dependent hydrolase (beta-lactamase superfamily II)